MIPRRLKSASRRNKVAFAIGSIVVFLVASIGTAVAAEEAPTVKAVVIDDLVVASVTHFPANAEVKIDATVAGGKGSATVKTSATGRVLLGFQTLDNFTGKVDITATSGSVTKSASVTIDAALTPPTTAAPATTTSTTAAPVAPAPAPTTPAAPVNTAAGKFTFAVLPDTQMEVFAGDTRFANRTQYLVDNKDKLNLAFVTNVGDVLNWPSVDPAQGPIAAAAYSKLTAAGIPWSGSVGNHDTGATCKGGSACPGKNIPQAVRDTSDFNKAFNAANYGAVKGAFEAGKVDNIYSTFNAGGAKWMVLNLELWPRVEAVNWAKTVVAEHPNYNVIVATHHYLDPNGTISGSNGGYGANSPQYVYDNLISKYANIKMVFSGHLSTEAARTDTGVNGNKIYSFLLDMHDDKSNPMRFVEVDTAANSFSTYVYAPQTNKRYNEFDRSYSGAGFVK